MKLFWHIGPHKTGTTSLQVALAARASSGQATYYYPPTPEFGPGHAALAWQFLGLNGRARDPDVLFAEIDRAETQGFSKVVLSSEEFSRALLKAESFEPFARVCERIECELVITLRPLSDRVFPELQEMIKHGHKIQFTNSQELLDAVTSRPGLRPDFLPAAIYGTKAASVAIILVDQEAPQKLFDDMSTIVGEPIPRTPSANASYSFIKTAWLEVLNRYGGVMPKDARPAVDAAFLAAAREMEALGDVPYPALPPVLQRYLDSVWELQLAFLRALQDADRVRCL